MSFSRVIDIESLLQSIATDAPAGVDLRVDRSPTSAYYSLKDARNNARAAERSSMFDEGVDLLKPWRTVIELAPDILIRHSKDLEVACWFAEGLIRLHGVAGLRDGFKLIHGLVKEYWQDLYPQIDEDGLETKLAPLTGLNGDGGEGTLMAPIRNMGITNEGDYGSFNLWQFQKARDNAKLTDEDERASRIDALGFSLQDIEDTVRDGSPQFYADLVATVEECLADYKGVHAWLRSQCGQDAPPSSNIASLLDEVLRNIRFLSKDKLETLPAITEADQIASNNPILEDGSFAASPACVNPDVSGPIGNREEALRRLQEIADYFRRHEPHTPLAPGIERLVRWGRMTVAELMMELLPEDNSRGFFSQLTGLKLDGSDAQKYIPLPVPVATPSASPSASAQPDKSDKPDQAEPVEAPKVAHGW